MGGHLAKLSGGGSARGFQEWDGGGSTRLVECEGTSDMLGEVGHQGGGGTKIGVG